MLLDAELAALRHELGGRLGVDVRAEGGVVGLDHDRLGREERRPVREVADRGHAELLLQRLARRGVDARQRRQVGVGEVGGRGGRGPASTRADGARPNRRITVRGSSPAATIRAALSKTVETDRSKTVETPRAPMAAAAASFTPSSTDGGLEHLLDLQVAELRLHERLDAMTPLLRWWERPGRRAVRPRPAQRLEHGADLAAHARDGVGAAAAHEVTEPRGPARGAGVDAPPPPRRRCRSRPRPRRCRREEKQGAEALGGLREVLPVAAAGLDQLAEGVGNGLEGVVRLLRRREVAVPRRLEAGLEQALGDVEAAHVVEQVRHHERLEQGVAVAERRDGQRVLHREDGVGSGPDRRRTDLLVCRPCCRGRSGARLGIGDSSPLPRSG